MKSALALIVFFLLLWGFFGIADGVGFIGGIKQSIKAIWDIIGFLGRILVVIIIIGLCVKAP
jgi:hypothetical protein